MDYINVARMDKKLAKLIEIYEKKKKENFIYIEC